LEAQVASQLLELKNFLMSAILPELVNWSAQYKKLDKQG
jgi:hypothetical protein